MSTATPIIASAPSRRIARKQQRAANGTSSDSPPSPTRYSSDSSSGDEHPGWSDSDTESDDEPQPIDIDESWPYTFQAGEQVWIRTSGGNWHPGQVTGQKTKTGPTREKEGVFYPVIFNKKIRKFFAPLNGDIKPDTKHTRTLLAEAGFLNDDSE